MKNPSQLNADLDRLPVGEKLQTKSDGRSADNWLSMHGKRCIYFPRGCETLTSKLDDRGINTNTWGNCHEKFTMGCIPFGMRIAARSGQRIQSP
jgi:hypothetical protein